ncbi:hypothetical protein HNY73_007459 [Argiope bruennichi]|uniref:Uncharacterized protein n=1 Tax=Argiope bruennichi TaxID=94029 RepID=A0A8T0FE08_ARGBR|nr:hypothetical protein HNY73_007459 [Argiope bruennichi]
MMQDLTQDDDSTMLRFDSSTSLGEPSQQPLPGKCYSYPLSSLFPRNNAPYYAFDETADGMQATCSPPLCEKDPYADVFPGFNSQTPSRLYDNGLTRTLSGGHSDRLSGTFPNESLYNSESFLKLPTENSGLDMKFPTQTRYDCGSDIKLPTQACYGSGLDRTFPTETCYGSGLDRTFPTETCYGSGLDRTFPTETCYGSGLDRTSGFDRTFPTETCYSSGFDGRFPIQTCYGSGLDGPFPTQSCYHNELRITIPDQTYCNSGSDITHPYQTCHDGGLLKTSTSKFQHFNQVEPFSRRLRVNTGSQKSPAQHSESEVPPPFPNPCAKRNTKSTFQEQNLINEHATGTFQDNSIFNNTSFDRNRWYRLPSKLLKGDKKLKAQIKSISQLEDPIPLNIFLSGTPFCGQLHLLKKFLKKHVELPKNYDFNQGFIALMAAYGREMSIKFSIIKNLNLCHEELQLTSENRKRVLVLVYNLKLPFTLFEIDRYVMIYKQYFIESQVPIVLVGKTTGSKISTEEGGSRYLSNYKGGSDVWSAHSSVMKAYCKCSQKTGENVDKVFFLAIKSALEI